ncbi:hypothetical protein AVEN_159115-1 [Araneus ventricosus]|uniref:Uncharacterized protein n=1 Tax=Araneus ventricosus TaxID=182803 RepID=A0A4Y2B806_ARAVE|nr:hypothetical protein AVEN_159115-1 [Araneus ventricosus]
MSLNCFIPFYNPGGRLNPMSLLMTPGKEKHDHELGLRTSTTINLTIFKKIAFEFRPNVAGMRPTMRKKSKSFLKETLEMLLPMEFSEVLDEEDSDHEETDNDINDLSSDE